MRCVFACLQDAFAESCNLGQCQFVPTLTEGCPCHLQGSQSGLYAAVLVAVPLELTNITISGVEHKALPLRKYQRTVTTLVSGQLRPSYFGVEQLPKGARLPLVFLIISAMHLVCDPTPIHSQVEKPR